MNESARRFPEWAPGMATRSCNSINYYIYVCILDYIGLIYKKLIRKNKIEDALTTLQPLFFSMLKLLIIKLLEVVSGGSKKWLQPTYNRLQPLRHLQPFSICNALINSKLHNGCRL